MGLNRVLHYGLYKWSCIPKSPPKRCIVQCIIQHLFSQNIHVPTLYDMIYQTNAVLWGMSSYELKHDDVIKWKHFPRYWPFVDGIHRSPVNSPHKGQWCGALMFLWSAPWINGWVNNWEASDLRRHHAHYDVTVLNIVARCLAFIKIFFCWCSMSIATRAPADIIIFSLHLLIISANFYFSVFDKHTTCFPNVQCNIMISQ